LEFVRANKELFMTNAKEQEEEQVDDDVLSEVCFSNEVVMK